MTTIFSGFRGFALIATTILFSVLFLSCNHSAADLSSLRDEKEVLDKEKADLSKKNTLISDSLKMLQKESKEIIKMIQVRAVEVKKTGVIELMGTRKNIEVQITFFAADGNEYVFKKEENRWEKYRGVYGKKDIAELNVLTNKFQTDVNKIKENPHNFVIGVQNGKVISVLPKSNLF